MSGPASPNPQLVAPIAQSDAPELDVGCREAADAIRLAGRGWDVVATDISSVALEERVKVTVISGGIHQQWPTDHPNSASETVP
jgi:hypothetical protein